MTKIKICGLTRPEDIAAVNRYLPEYIGFVFAESRRRVTGQQASWLKQGLDDRIQAVGVFVNEKVPVIADLCNSGIIDMIQLHGDENQAFIKELKYRTDRPIIKALRVQNQMQIWEAQQLPCDYLLLDTYVPDRSGGSGQLFDHRLIPVLQKPYFLAGGLNNENIPNIVEHFAPYAVDVSSGVETEGSKDDIKIRDIINTVRVIRPSHAVNTQCCCER